MSELQERIDKIWQRAHDEKVEIPSWLWDEIAWLCETMLKFPGYLKHKLEEAKHQEKHRN